MSDEYYSEYCAMCLKVRLAQNDLIEHSSTQNLTWNVIFLLGEIVFGGRKAMISDVVNPLPGSRQSILATISSMVEKGILDKVGSEEDLRRRYLNFTPDFQEKFIVYLRSAIDMHTQLVIGQQFLREENYGGYTLDQLVELSRNPVDGAEFYIAFKKALPSIKTKITKVYEASMKRLMA